MPGYACDLCSEFLVAMAGERGTLLLGERLDGDVMSVVSMVSMASVC